MKIKVDTANVTDLLDADQVDRLPDFLDFADAQKIYEGMRAVDLIDALVDAYSGNGLLICPLDDEASRYVAESESNWSGVRYD